LFLFLRLSYALGVLSKKRKKKKKDLIEHEKLKKRLKKGAVDMEFTIQFYNILKVKHQAWREDVIECRHWLTQMTR